VPSRLRAYQAGGFESPAHPTRIAVVEMLRGRPIVVNRNPGSLVFYSLPNPVPVEVLEIMKRYGWSNLTHAIQLPCEVAAILWVAFWGRALVDRMIGRTVGELDAEMVGGMDAELDAGLDTETSH
jgi:hypothetical protein